MQGQAVGRRCRRRNVLRGTRRWRLTVKTKGVPHLRLRCTETRIVDCFSHFPCLNPAHTAIGSHEFYKYQAARE
jgi:hypothetical protein